VTRQHSANNLPKKIAKSTSITSPQKIQEKSKTNNKSLTDQKFHDELQKVLVKKNVNTCTSGKKN